MNRKHKFKNIESANLLAEQRYFEEKGISEGWKENIAAGLATAGAGMGAQAQQAPTDPVKAPVTQQVQGAVDKAFGADVANPFNANNTNTLPIVGIQTGVTDGKTGKSAVYVYHNRLPSDPEFNPKTDRETVYTENLPNLRNTDEYKAYMAKKGQNVKSDNRAIAMNESKRAIVRNFSKVFNAIKRDDDQLLS